MLPERKKKRNPSPDIKIPVLEEETRTMARGGRPQRVSLRVEALSNIHMKTMDEKIPAELGSEKVPL